MSKGKGRSNGRVTAKKEKAPKAFMTVTDAAGNTKTVEVQGEPVSQEEMEAQQFVQQRARQAAAEQDEARLKMRARIHGLWIPGME